MEFEQEQKVVGVRDLIELHEAEDRTLVLLTSFQTFVQEHKAVAADPELKVEAEGVVEKLKAVVATLGDRVTAQCEGK